MKPTVVFLDNDPEAEDLLPSTVMPRFFLPSEIREKPERREAFESALDSADLILIDHQLDLGDELTLTVFDGASFVANLRSWARTNRKVLPPVVIVTAEQNAYEAEDPSVGPDVPLEGTFVGNEHRIAPGLDVEWILAKLDHADLGRKIYGLGSSHLTTKKTIGNNGATVDELVRLLQLPKSVQWRRIAVDHLRWARPPITQGGTHEAAGPLLRGPATVIRWLLHRALPFAGLFLSDVHVAWALGLSLKSFRKFLLMRTATDLGGALSEARYAGPLNDFFEARWWKAGIDSLRIRLADEATLRGSLRAALRALGGVNAPNPMAANDTIVVYDARFLPSRIAPIADAVELHVRGWPAEAMEPWMLKHDVEKDPLFAAMTVAN